MHPPLRLDVRAKALQRVRPANQHQSQRQARRDQDKPPHASLRPHSAIRADREASVTQENAARVSPDTLKISTRALVTPPQSAVSSRPRDRRHNPRTAGGEVCGIGDISASVDGRHKTPLWVRGQPQNGCVIKIVVWRKKKEGRNRPCRLMSWFVKPAQLPWRNGPRPAPRPPGQGIPQPAESAHPRRCRETCLCI